jgi:hypothetical protein
MIGGFQELGGIHRKQGELICLLLFLFSKYGKYINNKFWEEVIATFL